MVIATTIFVLTFAKGAVWAEVVPIWQTPDEPDHFAYVETLAREDGWRPRDAFFSVALQSSMDSQQSYFMFHQPLSRMNMAPDWAKRRSETLEQLGSEARGRSSGQYSRATAYPPLYYWVGARAYDASDGRQYLDLIHSMRIYSALLTALTGVIAFFCFRLLFDDAPRQLAATSMTMLLPGTTNGLIAINSDVLVTLLATGFFLLALRTLRTTLRWRTATGLGVLLGAGMLTKQSFVPVLAMFTVLVGFLAAMRRVPPLRALGLLAVGSLAAGLISVTYYGTGGPGAIGSGAVNGSASPNLTVTGFATHVVEFSTGRFKAVVAQYWGTFGWVDTPIDPRMMRAISVVCTVAALGLLIGATRALRRRRADPALPFLAVCLAGWTLFLLILDYVLVTNGSDPGGFLQGRYFLPMLVPINALLTQGIVELMPRQIHKSVLALTIPPLVTAYFIICLFGYVVPRYYL